MTLWLKNGGDPQELPREDRLDDGTIYTDLENNEAGREALGWVAAPPMPDAADGHSIQWVNGAWAQVLLPPPPPAPRLELAKLTVSDRVNALGKMNAVWAALQSDPGKLNLWFLDGPNVYADDPNLHALLAAAGLTADQITVVCAA